MPIVCYSQPLGAGMDAVLSTLLIGFTVLSFLLSKPSPKKLLRLRAKTNAATTSSTTATDAAMVTAEGVALSVAAGALPSTPAEGASLNA